MTDLKVYTILVCLLYTELHRRLLKTKGVLRIMNVQGITIYHTFSQVEKFGNGFIYEACCCFVAQFDLLLQLFAIFKVTGLSAVK